MEKKMRKAGASYSVVIPKAFLEILKINPEKNLIKLEIKANKIVMTKGNDFED